MSHALRKRSAVAIALICLFVTIVGCSGKTGNEEQAAPVSPDNASGSAEENTASNASNDPKTFTKYDPPVTITVARPVTGSVFFKPGETIDDNVHTRWVKDNLGIEMKHTITAGTEEDIRTKMRLALASNKEWPDIFVTGDLQLLSEMISSGRIMELNDVIANYPDPKLKSLYDKYPEAFYPATRDSKIYGLPVFMEGNANPPQMFIREDWLQNLGLSAPTTIAELENVMDKFTTGDPDGNGQADTFGLALSLKNGIMTGMAGSDAIAGAFGDSLPQVWSETADGSLAYGSIDPKVKDVLGTMRSWMEKGYMDPEAGIVDESKAAEAFVQGKAGIIFGPMWLPIWPLNATKQNNPSAVIKAYPVPAGPDGNKGFEASGLASQYIVFSKDFKYMDGFIAYMDAISGTMLGGSDVGTGYGFFDGYDYVTHDGKVYFNNLEANGVPKDKWPKEDGSLIEVFKYFSFYGATQFEPPGIFEESAKKYIADPNVQATTAVDAEVLARWPRESLDAYVILMNDKANGIPDMFTGAPTKTMQSKKELLTKLENESFNKIIYGNESLDYFDTFVDNWKKNGGEQITQEVNEWYKNLE